MTYEDAAEFADSTKKYGSILGLESIRNLMQELGNVQEQLHIIHVAGTNGKGSVCAFLSAALTEAGYRVGRYNSPAVFERREVFRIGETMISKEEYAAVFERVQTACEVLTKRGCPHPTVFEVETAAAFLWFYEKKCDLVLLETGMGGETDATNLITHPVCSVLTSIGMDHMQYLGNTIEEIAKVKAGIIKKRCPVVALKQGDSVCEVIKNKAEECGSRCVLVEVPASVEENVMTEQGQRQGDTETMYTISGAGNNAAGCTLWISTYRTWRCMAKRESVTGISSLKTVRRIRLFHNERSGAKWDCKDDLAWQI